MLGEKELVGKGYISVVFSTSVGGISDYKGYFEEFQGFIIKVLWIIAY